MLDFSHGRARRRCTFLLKFLQLKCTTRKSALVRVNLSEYFLHKKRLYRCCTFFLAAASFSSRPVSAIYWFTTFCHIHTSFGASLYNTSVLCGPFRNSPVQWTGLSTALNVNYRLFSLSCPLYWRLGARNSRHNESVRFTPSHLLSARSKEKSRITRSHSPSSQPNGFKLSANLVPSPRHSHSKPPVYLWCS